MEGVLITKFEADIRSKDRAKVDDIQNSRWYMSPDISRISKAWKYEKYGEYES